MDSAGSVVRGFLGQLTSPRVFAAVLAMLIALAVSLVFSLAYAALAAKSRRAEKLCARGQTPPSPICSLKDRDNCCLLPAS